jgi:hypothetical protein
MPSVTRLARDVAAKVWPIVMKKLSHAFGFTTTPVASTVLLTTTLLLAVATGTWIAFLAAVIIVLCVPAKHSARGAAQANLAM